jgi:aryl-alcohol dehydrogenase (NADP+)
MRWGRLRGWTPLIALQVEYSLMARTVESELAPRARANTVDLGPRLWAGKVHRAYRRTFAVNAADVVTGTQQHRRYRTVSAHLDR